MDKLCKYGSENGHILLFKLKILNKKLLKKLKQISDFKFQYFNIWSIVVVDRAFCILVKSARICWLFYQVWYK